MGAEVAGNRAIAYVRVSTGTQGEDGNSIAQQTRRVQEYAKFRGLNLLGRDIIPETAVSAGIPLFDRPAGGLLLDRIETGKYDHVIAVKLDRMFRITTDAIDTIDQLSKAGVSMHFVDFQGQTLDTSSATGRALLTVVAAFAEMERGLISERTKDGMAYLKRNLKRFTRSLFGWNVRKDGSLVPNWKEQDLIDYMVWQMDGNDISATAVARSLNKRGSTGKQGGTWQSSSVINVANNDFHGSRNDFPLPKNWGKRPWHRKEIVPENEGVG